MMKMYMVVIYARFSWLPNVDERTSDDSAMLHFLSGEIGSSRLNSPLSFLTYCLKAVKVAPNSSFVL